MSDDDVGIDNGCVIRNGFGIRHLEIKIADVSVNVCRSGHTIYIHVKIG